MQIIEIKYKNIEFFIKSILKFKFFVIIVLISLSNTIVVSQDNQEKNKEYLNNNKNLINSKKDTYNFDYRNFKKPEPDFLKNGREEKFLVVGASIGSPSSLNINVGYYIDRLVLRGSGMYFNPNWNGQQFDLGYSIYKTSQVIFGFSFVMGNFHVSPFAPDINKGGQTRMVYDDFPIGYQNNPQKLTDQYIRSLIAKDNPDLAVAFEYLYRTRQEMNFSQNYLGGAFDFYLDGFWLQLGLGAGRGDYRNPQLLIQLGYLIDFGKKDR